MNIRDFITSIHFASPVFILAGIGVLLVFFVVWRRKNSVVYSHAGFFGETLVRKPRNPLFLAYGVLPLVILAATILAIGNIMRETSEISSRKITPYFIVADFSGSLASSRYDSKVPTSFEESILNSSRVALMRFVEEEKGSSEFFLLLYSDTPYAARYFAGGEEAATQIVGFLEALPAEIQVWQNSQQRFYLKGTHTAFALEAALRYYESFPEEYRASVLILITDLEDPEMTRIGETLNLFIEQGLERRMYVIVPSNRKEDKNSALLQHFIRYQEQVRIFEAQDDASLHAAFQAIGDTEDAPRETQERISRTRSLRHLFLYAAIGSMFLYVLIEELYVRKIP